MQSPLISVIIPAYNHESYIVDAIQSVLKQSFSDFEVIVIDDGSTDNTLYEIKKITDPRIRLFHQKNIGAAATINRGIDLSQGQYITILNSDDVYHYDRLAIFKEYMDDHPDVMVLSSLIQPVDVLGNELTPDSGNTVHQYWLEWYERAVQNIGQDDHYFYSLLQSNFVVSTSNIFVNARLFENEKKFDPFLYYCHDYEFLLRALQVHRFGLIHQKLLKYRLHDLNTIRHNDFFKRFEVQYAVFHALEFHDLLSHPPDVQQRLSSILFRGLERNPDINHDIIASEKNGMLEQSELWLKEAQMNARHFEDRLMQAEKQNECLQSRIVESQKQNECLQARIVESQKQNECLHARILEMNARIQEKDLHLSNLIEEIRQKDMYLDDTGNYAKNWKEIAERKQEDILELNRRIVNLENSVALHRQVEIDFKTRIHQQSIQLHAADARMITAENKAAEKERLLQEIFHSKGWRWLTRYRDAKLKFMSRHPVIDKSQPVTDDKTYHAVIHHAMKANRPKVIHAIANFLTGGSSRLVVDLVEHLGHIYDQEVMSFFIPSPLAYANVSLHDFSGDITDNQVEEFLKEKKAKILHVHYWGEGDSEWYRKIFKSAENWNGILIENINTPVVPYISDRVDHYVYVSEYARNFAACIPGKSSVIYPGSDFTLFDRKDTPIPDDVIGMVYRLDPDKLKEDAIQVFIDVVKKRPTTQVLIVGGGYFYQSYQAKVAEEGATANFQFTNYVPYATLPDYYKKFSVFVAPVWKESFGQVSPFAMSMKLPIAGYRIGALPEILGDDEFLGKDRDELSDIIVKLLNDRSKRIEIGQRNYDRAHEHFSVEAMTEAYNALYQRLLGE